MVKVILTLEDLAYDAIDLSSMVKTVTAEAAGEPWMGKVAVCWVIVNRALRPGWWSRNPDEFKDDTVAAVCHDPSQFSCWNPGSPGLKFIENMNINTPGFKESAMAVAVVLGNMVPDPTKESTHYHTLDVSPKWSRGLTPIVKFGHHLFYNNVP